MATPGLLIQGLLRNSADGPIEDGHIWIASGPGAFPDVAALSDSNGGFVLSVPATGTYEIVVSADGYHEVRQVVNVPIESAASAEFRLSRSG